MEIIAKTRDTSDRFFVDTIDKRIRRTVHPYFAFNARFDMALISKLLGREIGFDGELQVWQREKKKYVTNDLHIPNFDDPFSGEGFLASKEWTRHLQESNLDSIMRIIAHNLACTLVEYRILMLRGFRIIESSSHKPFLEGEAELLCGNRICDLG